MKWWLIAIAALLLVWMVSHHEGFVEATDRDGKILGGPGTRPSLSDGAWRSKIEVQIPIGGGKEDYERALQSFYDTIYEPIRRENPTGMPKDTQVEVFLSTQPATIDKNALRQIILSGFAVDRTSSASAREEKQVKFTPSEALEPRDGVLETWKYVRQDYIPVDSRIGDLPEGVYAPTPQEQGPRREGTFDDKSASWTGQRPYSLGQNVVKGQ
jgi:hypothetical protein